MDVSPINISVSVYQKNKANIIFNLETVTG